MKKRKELDALVPNGKVRKKHSSGSGSTGTELLRVDSDTTDTEDFSSLSGRRFNAKKGACLSRVCAICVPLCTLILVTACVVGSGTLLWMQFNMRQEVDLLRDHIRKVEEGNKIMSSEFHDAHSQLKELQINHSSLRDDVATLNRTLDFLAKEISVLKSGVGSLKKSLAEAPVLETLPSDFKVLQSSVASMGSKITDFESKLVQMKNQPSAISDIKKQMDGPLEALKLKVDSLASLQQVSDNSPKTFAYVDAEAKRLDNVIMDMNTTVWEKLNWAVEDLHEHHSSLQNLTMKVAKLENNDSAAASSVGMATESLLRRVQLTTEEVANKTIFSLLGDGSLVLLDKENATLSALVDYVRNLTRLYLVLLANKQVTVGGKLLNDFIDLNVTSVLQNYVDVAVDSIASEKLKIIQDMNATLTDLLQWCDSSRNVSLSTTDELKSLKQQVNRLLSSSTPRDSSLPSFNTTDAKPTENVDAVVAKSQDHKGAVSYLLSNSTQDVHQNDSVVTTDASSPAFNITSTTTTAAPISINVTSATVASQGTNVTSTEKVFKPSHTGGSFDDPNLRKPEDSASD